MIVHTTEALDCFKQADTVMAGLTLWHQIDTGPVLLCPRDGGYVHPTIATAPMNVSGIASAMVIR